MPPGAANLPEITPSLPRRGAAAAAALGWSCRRTRSNRPPPRFAGAASWRTADALVQSAPDTPQDSESGGGGGLAVELSLENMELRRQVRELENRESKLQDELVAARRQESDSCRSFGARAVAEAMVERAAKTTAEDDFAAELESGDGRTRQRLLYLYASPLQMPALGVDAEISALREVLSPAGVDLEVKVASVSSLGQAAIEPDAWVHITAHTSNKGKALCLEAESTLLGESVCRLECAGLEELLNSAGGARNTCVFVAACESAQVAHSFRAAGVPHVVFCPTVVHDKRALCFAKSFYGALGRQLSLEHAFSIARCAAELTGDDAQYGLLSTGGQVRLPVTTLAWQTPLPKPRDRQSLKRCVEDFVGRREVLRDVASVLGAARRLVLLHCSASLGRTATLKQIAHLMTMPGRKFASSGRCAFFPGEAPGGLLIVDDAEALTEEEKGRIRQHLEHEGSQLLAGCRSADVAAMPSGEDFCADVKPICVELPPLRPPEAAELFLRRCQRALLVEDLLLPGAYGGRDPREQVQRTEALALLQKPISAFAGIPGKIRRAVDDWSKRDSPPLHGTLDRLAWAVGLPGLAGRSTRPLPELPRRLGPRWQ